MAFQPGSVATKYKEATSTGSSAFQSGSIASKYKTSSANNLKSSQGLYDLAVKNGLQSDADRLLAEQAGEKTNKFMSGGVIMDTVDVLSALQYGVVGMIKGKTFMEGVKTRQSFSDKDSLGSNGIPGMIGGILLDIAFDPLTYIAPYTIAKKIPVLGRLAAAGKKAVFGEKIIRGVDNSVTYKNIEEAIKAGAKTYETVEGGTKLGRFLTEKLAYSYGSDPVFLRVYEQGTKNIAVTQKKITQFGKAVANLTPDISKQLIKVVDNQGRLGMESFEVLAKKLTPEQLAPVAKLYKLIEDLGEEAVNLNLLSREVFEKNKGEYLKQAYMEFEQKTANKLPFGFASVGQKGIKSRVEELSAERMADRIENPAYLLMKTAIDLTRDVENAKMFKEINKRFATDIAQPGFTKMSDGIRLGELAGKYVPDHMAPYLNQIIEPVSNPIERYLIGNFKYAKVVLNPATHIRNIMSNMVLNYWKLGMNPLDPRTISAQKEALAEIATGTGKWIDEATPLGYNLDTFASQELKGILESPEMITAMGKASNKWQAAKKTLGDIYQGEENFAKLTAYIYQRKVAKLTPEEAWKAAESATFNYAQVTPFIRKMRTSIWGMPFITFTYKATPLAIETALKHPERISVIGKIKNSLEEQSDLEMTDRERAAQPPWVKDGFYIKLPGEDKYGRSKYFDLTYILPFGDLMSGSLFERGIKTDTGTPESVGEAVLRKNPVTQLIMELGRNRNFYGNKIWKDSDPAEKQATDILLHILKTTTPPPLAEQIPNGYNASDGTREWKGIPGGLNATADNQQRTFMQELLRNAGVKIQPMNVEVQETYQEYNKKKALETLLRERGVMKGFNVNYVPDAEEEILEETK